MLVRTQRKENILTLLVGIQPLWKTILRFLKGEDIQWPTGIWKKYSTSLIIREMQIKTTMRWNIISSQLEWLLGKRQKTTDIDEVSREKWTLIHCGWECKQVQSLWKTAWSFLKEIKVDLPFDPAIPLLGIYPKEMNHYIKGIPALTLL